MPVVASGPTVARRSYNINLIVSVRDTALHCPYLTGLYEISRTDADCSYFEIVVSHVLIVGRYRATAVGLAPVSD